MSTIDKEAVINATVGNFYFDTFTPPIFRTATEHLKRWGHWVARDANQKSDAMYYLTIKGDSERNPSGSSQGALKNG